MGCCSMRPDKKRFLELLDSLPASKNEEDYFSSIASEGFVSSERLLTFSHKCHFSDGSEDNYSNMIESDRQASEISSIVKQLQSQTTWKVYSQTPNSFIESIEGSPINRKVPVFKMRYVQSKTVPLTLIAKLILDPLYRQQWDSSVSLLDTLSVKSTCQLVQRSVLKIKFLSREIIEEKVIRLKNDEITIVSYSTAKEESHADVIFCLLNLSLVRQKICVEIVSQIDFKLPWGMNNRTVYGKINSAWFEEFISAICSIN